MEGSTGGKKMKRLPGYLLVAMMLPMLGVWSAAEAAPKQIVCPKAKFKISGNGITMSFPKSSKWKRVWAGGDATPSFDYAEIDKKSRLGCYYKDGPLKFWVERKRCAQGPGFIAKRGQGIKCRKPRTQCKAICN